MQMLSDARVAISLHYARCRAAKNFNLVQNLMNKNKLNGVITFAQAPWMENYTCMNTSMCAPAKGDIENHVPLLMANAVYD